MKFATIMREAGLITEFWPKCSKIKVNLYDDKEHLVEVDDVKFVQPLFSENNNSRDEFVELIDYLDANFDTYESIDIQISANHVIVFYNSPHATIFRRTPSPDPLIFAD